MDSEDKGYFLSMLSLISGSASKNNWNLLVSSPISSLKDDKRCLLVTVVSVRTDFDAICFFSC